MAWATVAVEGGALIAGGIKTISSANKAKRDRATADQMKQPFLKLQDEYLQNRNMAEMLATGGMPIDTKNFISTERDRGLSTSLGALTKAGAGPNDIAALNDSYDKSVLNQASQDAQQHLKNIGYYMDTNKDVAGQKTTQYGVNELQPYEAKLKEITERRKADQENLWSGISEIIGSAGALSTTLNSKNLKDKLFTDDPHQDLSYVNAPIQKTGGEAGKLGADSIDTSTLKPLELNIST